jgi:hypothetical protein
MNIKKIKRLIMQFSCLLLLQLSGNIQISGITERWMC